MNRSHLRRAGLAVAGAALLAGGATQALASPVGTSAARGATIKIKLRGSGDDAMPYFTKVKTIHRGAKLTIVNTTDVQAIGPHTFSLAKRKALPKGAKAQRECGEELSGLCGTVAQAHEFNPETMGVDKPIVEVGRKGWDKSFGKTGDSWYTETKGESTTRRVTAKVGTTLTFFCAVHPNMVGHIKVVK